MSASADRIRIARPDDWHVHLRDGACLATTVAHTARCFGRAIAMPNLVPPITTAAKALAYKQRILQALPVGVVFEPLMTLYLTEHTAPEEITQAKNTGQVVAAKLYPAGATTHSEAGVGAIGRLYPVLERMQDVRMPLLIHGEVTDPGIDIFDRERVFIERELIPLVERFPQLRIVLEHITTRDAAEFVTTAPAHIAATVTPHHLLLNRNDMLVGGIRPHHYCLPVLKRETHRAALVQAATSGNPKFFLGTDSAPHAKGTKEAACGCAGIYTAHAAIELYAEVFDSVGALDKLEGFASFHGPDHYGLPRNNTHITLRRDPWTVPASYTLVDDELIPFRAGGTMSWRMERSATNASGSPAN